MRVIADLEANSEMDSEDWHHATTIDNSRGFLEEVGAIPRARFVSYVKRLGGADSEGCVMNYLVTCTFDLKAATVADYQNAYAALKNIGLHKASVSESGSSVVAPTTMTLGQFTGQSAVSVRDSIRQRVKDAFAANHLRSEIFVTVSGDWAWGVASA